MESCMVSPTVMPAYHDAFSKETDPQLLNRDALPQNMRDAGLLLLNIYWLWVIELDGVKSYKICSKSYKIKLLGIRLICEICGRKAICLAEEHLAISSIFGHVSGLG